MLALICEAKRVIVGGESFSFRWRHSSDPSSIVTGAVEWSVGSTGFREVAGLEPRIGFVCR